MRQVDLTKVDTKKTVLDNPSFIHITYHPTCLVFNFLTNFWLSLTTVLSNLYVIFSPLALSASKYIYIAFPLSYNNTAWGNGIE